MFGQRKPSFYSLKKLIPNRAITALIRIFIKNDYLRMNLTFSSSNSLILWMEPVKARLVPLFIFSVHFESFYRFWNQNICFESFRPTDQNLRCILNSKSTQWCRIERIVPITRESVDCMILDRCQDLMSTPDPDGMRDVIRWRRLRSLRFVTMRFPCGEVK